MQKNTKTKSPKAETKDQLQCIYSSDKITAYELDIKEGVFLVLDYHSKELDFEIYWARYVESVCKGSSEYKAVYKIMQKHLERKD